MPPTVREPAGAAACGTEVRHTKAEEEDGAGTTESTEALPASEDPNTRDDREVAAEGPDDEPGRESKALSG